MLYFTYYVNSILFYVLFSLIIIMEEYLKKYNNFTESRVYRFRWGEGGIGDCTKFFMFLLYECIEKNYKIYYLITNSRLEKYLLLKNNSFYITQNNLHKIGNYTIVTPGDYYNSFDYDKLIIPTSNIFTFSNIIINNVSRLLRIQMEYISIHIRLGDKFLETDKRYVICKNDNRGFNEEKTSNYILNNSYKNIILFSDNNALKVKLKKKHENIIILNSKIGHTSFKNTSEQQVIDTITEFYILTQSNEIIVNTESGFSIMASKFNHVPLSPIY